MKDNSLDLRSLNYSEPNPNLICCICQTPFIDPVISPCGHTFCQSCIYQAIETSSHCPIDRAPLEIENLIPAVKIITNMVNELIVQCPRLDAGCDYQGQRQFIQNHLDNDCLYSSSACQMEECKALVYKKDFASHTSTCLYRTKECLMCKKKLRAIQFQEHHTQCPAELIECSYCSTSRTRSEHSDHLTTCPRHPVVCVHNSFGCTWAGERCDQDNHINQCAYEPIKHFLIKQQRTERSLRQDVEQLQQENNRLKEQQEELREQVQITMDQLALLFPSHFPSQGSSIGPVLTETERLETEIESLNANLVSLELKQNMALMTETFRLQEEMQSLRTVCYGIRMHIHYMMMERKGSAMPSTSNTVPNANSNGNTNTNSVAVGSNVPGPMSSLGQRQWIGKRE
ncbi:hypothetical protein CLU79DRAFT_778137 [Phycomyces nitens]|nr:hypothetical protein CLU79DRAFT_778137 [Phycomyces nitens]